MNKIEDDLTYYRGLISDPELDSSPLADFEAGGFEEAEYCHVVPDHIHSLATEFCGKTETDKTDLAKTAFLILSEKYTNNPAALCAVSVDKRMVPVYLSSEEQPSFPEYGKAFLAQMETSRQHMEIRFEELCADLCLHSLPVLTSEDSFYQSFSLSDYKEMDAKICVFFSEKNNQLTAKAKYNQAIYSKKTMDRIFMSFDTILEAICRGEEKLASIPVLSKELKEELDSFNDNDLPYDDSVSIVDLIEEMMEKYSERIAVVYKEKKLTYRQLGELADRIAQYIQSLGIGKEDVVSILIPRCEYMPIAAIGVLKAGAAYQPLDPGYPPERLKFMMEDAQAKLLIADASLLSLVPDYHGKVLALDEIPQLPECTVKLEKPEKENLFILLYTSGSTGVPKGVMLEHRNLVAFCNWYRRFYDLKPESRVAAYASFGFDANMMDMYPALTTGAQVHIIDESIRLDLLEIRRYFEENEITHSFMTTQVGRQFADLFPDCGSLRTLSVGGETLVPVAPPNYRFHNVYGPTETTILTTAFVVDRLYKNVPIGKGLENIKLYVTDRQGNRVPVGVPGELWIAGPQVSRGYLNRPEQTEKAFIKNPFCDETRYGRIYRTGDVVRFLPDGCIEFIGRRDSQVKIRGFRIELTEVEGVIREFPGIKDATVIACDEAGGGKFIAAYVVSDEKVDIEALNAFILGQKPPYMVPAVTMQIARIPMNQNQKVDKRALPVPQKETKEHAAPVNEIQQQICDCLADVIGHHEFGITTDFYEAGLTSIGSMKFIVRLSEKCGVTVGIRQLAQYPTAKELEAYISEMQAVGQQEENAGNSAEGHDKYPLTQTQLGIYVECMMNPDSVFYNLPGSFTFDASMDVGKLCVSVRKVVDAHPAVKCSIRTDESGDTYMYPNEGREVEIECVKGTEEEYEKFFSDFAKPFDFENGPLYRIAVFSTEEHVCLVTDFHHIISDGTSIAVFAEELDRVMRGMEPLGESYTQFDLALEEKQRRSGAEYKKAKEYYDSLLSGVSECTVPDPDVHEGQESCGFYRQFCQKLSLERVQRFCQNHKITQNVFFTSVMGYVLGKYAYSEEACFTTIYNGRGDAQTAEMMGMLVKTLPMFCALDEGTKVSKYLADVQEQLRLSMAHDIYSFAEISRAYHIKPDIMFVYQGDDFVEFEIGGQKTIFREGVSDRAKADISINVFVEENQYRYEFEYRKNKYSEVFIERMYDILTEAALSFLTADTLGEVNITSPEQAAIVEDFNQTEYPVELISVNRLFEDWADRCPGRIAVIAGGETLTYGELNRLANRLAHGLIRRGLKLDTMVGLILDRNQSVYIVRQGILKAGGAFLPMVPEYPDDRIDFCLKDAACPFVITSEKLKKERTGFWEGKPYEVLTVEELIAEEIPDGVSGGRIADGASAQAVEQNPNLDIPVDTLAYCLYTSGSTGQPKGVMIEHGNLCNFVNSNPINTEITNYTDNGTVSLALAAITFDVSVMEEFIPLCNGMTICMASEEEIHNPLALAKLLIENKVDIMKCTPSYMTNIIEVPQMRPALAGIKAFDIGAEAFPPSLYGKMREVNQTAKIVNSYGPTECTVSCTTKVLDDGKEINIGGPLTNMKVYVVNRKNKVLPVGINGELIICGGGVGRGYVNLPDKNKAAFFHFKGMKAYHSGDLVRWNSKGEIVFLGRLDNQVKLRGLRVELDEIENAIHSFDGVKMSKVIVRSNGSEEYLAGYFTAEKEIDIALLTEHLKSKLTYYMVPGALMQLNKMPLTVNGKIDKKQLPDIEMTSEEREYVAPSTELEKEFCDKFAEVLNLERVGATDNFFEIGGTSLSATKIVMYAMTKDYPIVYKDVFANPTPSKLAEFITENSNLSEDAYHIKDYDYSAINALLEKNSVSNIDSIQKGEPGGVLLTGATGFLGIHVLRELLKNCKGKIYCIVRKGKYASSEKRLMNMLMYYFDHPFTEEFAERIACIDGDITNQELMMSLGGYDFTTVINCAACVKHFVNDDTLDRINVEGVKNIIAMCSRSGKRLVQISTTSVAGEGNALTVPFTKRMQENELYFGQIIENDYIRTKFLAERAVLEACAKGKLDAKIIRVGNLMSRKSDGEFQINFVTNGFMRTLNAYRVLGEFPMGAMHAPAEFSPIDSTAEAIVRLAFSQSDFTVFHAYNSHRIFMSDVIYAMNAYGFEVRIVSDEVFEQTLKSAAAQENKSDAVLGLIAYASDDENQRYELMADNRFTVEGLYRLGYKWPITDDTYLENAMRALDTLGFFD